MNDKRQGIKHLITCRCILPQFKNAFDPPFHKFRVFSVIDESDVVVPKFAQCDHCGIIHKVIDVARSEIIKDREELKSIMTIDDVKRSLPPELVELLEQNSVDIATWEHAKFILQNELWGETLVLSSDVVDNLRQGKYVAILGKTLYDIQAFTAENSFAI